MKSRTSFFNPTLFLKNLTRFAPVWVLYTVFLLLCELAMVSSGLQFAVELTHMPTSFAFLNFAYALIVSLLLFGDLYNGRLCNALHAMPVRREELFFTQVVSGLAFLLIPVLAALSSALLFSPAPNVTNWSYAPLGTLAAVIGQYLFFFGLATFSAMLVGSRFAQLLVYGLLNFASVLCCALVDILYTPMLYGLRTNEAPFLLFSPLYSMMEHDYLSYTRLEKPPYGWHYTLRFADGWGYLAVCAVVGLALLGLALVLYKRRKLEHAGDFMAVKACEPVFLVLYSLVMGALFHALWQIFIGANIPVLLFLGVSVGFFTGRMLLQRTVRVFRKKAWASCGILLLVIALTLVVTALDPLGLETWMPEKEEVESVTVYNTHTHYTGRGYYLTLDEQEDIETILQIHADVMENGNVDYSVYANGMVLVDDELIPADEVDYTALTLEYRLTDGTVVCRYYMVAAQSESGKILGEYYSSVECVLGVKETELAEFVGKIDYIDLDDNKIYGSKKMLSLLEAVAADCRAGTMAQISPFDGDEATWENIRMQIAVYLKGEGRTMYEFDVTVYADDVNTLRWLEENGIPLYDRTKK